MIIKLLCQVALFVAIFAASYLGIKQFLKLLNIKKYTRLASTSYQNTKIKLKQPRSILYKLQLIIDRSGLVNNDNAWLFTPKLLLLINILFIPIGYMFFYQMFKMISISVLMAIPCFFIPIVCLVFIGQERESRIEKVMGSFFLQLKNYTKIDNNIVGAFTKVQKDTIEPLSTYIQQFLAEINGGADFAIAIEHFKAKINIQRFKLFLTNIEHCYTYGGDFTLLLEKTYQFIANIQAEKKKRVQETGFAIIVLFILIGVDLFIYFDFLNAQPEYLGIMKTSFMGQAILNINFISIWFLLFLAYHVRKLDY